MKKEQEEEKCVKQVNLAAHCCKSKQADKKTKTRDKTKNDHSRIYKAKKKN